MEIRRRKTTDQFEGKNNMIEVVSVSFRTAGKVYYFRPAGLPVKRGLHVIVETARGTEYGTVVGDIKEIDEEEFSAPVKPILRIATPQDEEQEAQNRDKEAKAFVICKEKIAARNLEMKLIGVEYTFDNSKILFYFTADGRVDFRELVKDLAGVFRTRIELRQIGVRDETKIIGGIGICGRPLCCHTYLPDFAPVSIKMAKEQNLSLNPTKISGVCGRLMCCLKNEEDTYEYLNKLMPGIGDMVTAEGGSVEGEVHSVNVLRQTVKILVQVGDDEREIREYKVDELTFEPRKGGAKRDKRKDKKKRTKEEVAEELLEEQEEQELEKLIEADEEDLSRETSQEEKDQDAVLKKDRPQRRNRGNRKPYRQDGQDRQDRQDRRDRGGNDNRSADGPRQQGGNGNQNAGNGDNNGQRNQNGGQRDFRKGDRNNNFRDRKNGRRDFNNQNGEGGKGEGAGGQHRDHKGNNGGRDRRNDRNDNRRDFRQNKGYRGNREHDGQGGHHDGNGDNKGEA